MILSINEIVFVILLLIFLVILKNVILDRNFFKPFKRYYSSYGRNLQINNYIKEVSKKPGDSQKIIFREVIIFVTFLVILFILASKMMFFTAVVSDSMRTTFEKNDLVLIENFDHSYKIGDIIMFIEPFTLRPTTHRIIRIEKGVVRTAGDFTGVMDGWKINEKDILGKVVLIQGKPILIKRYGRFFIVDKKTQNLEFFGSDYRAYFMFFQVIKIYGYVIVVLCVVFYIALTFRKKSWQNR